MINQDGPDRTGIILTLLFNVAGHWTAIIRLTVAAVCLTIIDVNNYLAFTLKLIVFIGLQYTCL